MKRISIILICVIFISCATVQPTITSTKSAVAYASVLSIAQYVMPLFMAACIAWLIVKRTKEFKGCDEPIMPDMVEECNKLKEAEEIRKKGIH
jgi:hypothetical protein